MAFKFSVICDSCGAEENVPSPDSFPNGWIQIRYPATDLSGPRPGVKPVIQSVCSWRCLVKLGGTFVREEVQSQANGR